jgi:hypothetical protein
MDKHDFMEGHEHVLIDIHKTTYGSIASAARE